VSSVLKCEVDRPRIGTNNFIENSQPPDLNSGLHEYRQLPSTDYPHSLQSLSATHDINSANVCRPLLFRDDQSSVLIGGSVQILRAVHTTSRTFLLALNFLKISQSGTKIVLAATDLDGFICIVA
jgi:hypothetical protein